MKRSLLLIITLSICLSAGSQESNKNKFNVWGNTNSSLKQGGKVAYQDSVLYYANPRDSFKLYRMNIDGSNKRRICHDIPAQINVVGNYIFYINENSNSGKTGMYSISVNGRDRKFYDISTGYLRVHNRGIAYFTDNGCFNQLNTNKLSKTVEPVFIEKDYITNAYITTDYIVYSKYWENLSVNVRNGGLYIYDRATRKTERLLNANHIIMDFVVSDGWRWIFYSQGGGYYDNNSKQYPKDLYLISNNDKDPKRLPVPENAYLNKLNFIDKWLYYRSDVGRQNYVLYRISFDGKTIQQVSALEGDIYEAGDYLIFYDGKKLVRTLKDGRLEKVL